MFHVEHPFVIGVTITNGGVYITIALIIFLVVAAIAAIVIDRRPRGGAS